MADEKKKNVEVTSAMVKELREKTGAGRKAGRSAAEGAVGSYIHMGGKIGVLVEVNCETDFTAKNEKFLALVKDVAMQVAWTKAPYLRREDVPQAVIDQEKAVARA